jgi:gliding motility-associated-like protein
MLYHSELFGPSGEELFVFIPATGDDVFGEVSGEMTNDIITSFGLFDCYSAGSWTIRVWEASDLDNNGQVDRDGSGNIIGCYVEQVVTFNPGCPDPATVTAVANVTDIGCTSSGRITLQNFSTSDLYCVSSTGSGASISWTGPGGFSGSGTSISGLSPGTYTATISDGYGCPTTVSATVNSITPVTIASCEEIQSPSVFGGSNGSARVTINPGSGDYTISWTGPTSGNRSGVDGDNTISNLRAGTYTFTVTDDVSGCTSECMVTINDPPCEVAFEVEQNAAGDVVIRILGGAPNFFVSYVGPTNSPGDLGPFGTGGITLPGADFAGGFYAFTVYEQGRPACENFFTLTYVGPDCTDLMITNEDSSNPTCGNVEDGTITVGFTGLDNPIITWLGPGVTGSNSPMLTGLGAGTYDYQVTDDEGCLLEGSFTLTAPPSLTLSCDGINETRDALNDGMIALDVGGGSPGYTLSYTAIDEMGVPLPPLNGRAISTVDTLRNLMAGTYQITITDATGCTINCTTTITQPNCELFPDCVATDASVIGGVGSVELTFDGTPDWSIMITGPTDTSFVTSSVSEVIKDLPQGNYALEVFNDAGCAGTCNFSISGPTCTITVDTDFQNPTCSGGSDGAIFLDLPGQGMGLVIDWDDDLYDGQDTLRGLSAGTYQVILSDATGCVLAPITFTLVNPDSLRARMAIDADIFCAGDRTGGLTVMPQNGLAPFSYDWSVDSLPNSATVSGLIAGTYAVTVTDANGCQVVADTTLTEIPALSLSCGSIAESTIGANDGRVGFLLSGGTAPYDIQLNGTPIMPPADDTFRLLSPGQYVIDVMDVNGCTVSCTAVVNRGGCGDFTVGINATQPDCDNATGSATATPMMGNGTVTYLWSNGAVTETVNDLSPGTYEVMATDTAGCEAVNQVTIFPFADIPSVSINDFSTVCDDECTIIMLNFVGTPPFTLDYEIDRDGAQVMRQLVTSSVGDTTFTFCPADFGFPDLGNSTMVTFSTLVDGNGCSRPVDLNRLIPAQQTQVGNYAETICGGDTLRYFGEEFFAARRTGDVTLPFPASNGCDSTVTVTVDFFAPATGTLNETICAGDTLTYRGETFHASRTTGDVVLPDGSVNGCDSTVTVTVDFFAPATGTLNETICAGDTLTIQGEIFHASRTTGDVVLPDGSVNGCDSTVTVTVDFFAPATGTLNETICAGDTLTIGGEMFHASRTTGDVVLPDGSVNGCDSTVTVTVDFFAPATGTLNETICAGDTLTIQGEIFHASRTTGDVVLPDGSVNGCDSTVTVTVDFFAPATGTLNETICTGDTLTIQGEIFHASRTTGDVVIPDASVNGCDSTVTVTVDFFAPATGTLNETICTGDTLTIQGEIFHASRTTGDVVLPDASVNGCDSTVTVTVDFFAPATGIYNETICAGDTLTYRGEIFHASRTTGDVVIPDASANGCDSTVTVTVDFYAPATGTLNETICTGDTLTIQGEIFHASRTTGDVVLPDASANGCDSTVTVTVDFFAPATGIYNETICAGDTLTYRGEIFHASRTTGDVVLPDASVNGCDSTVTVDFFAPATVTVDFFAPATGMLRRMAVTTVNETICAGDTLTYRGEIFHASRTTGDVVLPDASVNGCDSTVTVTVDFFAPATGIYNETICAGDTLTIQGEIFHASRTTGDVVLPDASVNGCDSTVTVTVDFFAPATGIYNETICAGDTLTIQGEIFHASRTTGDVVLPDASANGCDSTVTVTVDFFAPATGIYNETICAGDTLTYQGEIFHASRTTGDVVIPDASANGCDSTVTVTVDFFAPATGIYNETICAGDTLTYRGETFHASRTTGDVVLPDASMNGCDSTVTVTVDFFAPAQSALSTTICLSDTFQLRGEIFHANRTSGDVIFPNASANGCDSTVSVMIDFFPQVMGAFDTTICAGTSFTYGGQLFDRAIDDFLVTLSEPTSNGCDSVVVVSVAVEELPTVSLGGDGIVCPEGELSISLDYDGTVPATVFLSSNPGEAISVPVGGTTIQRTVPPGSTVSIMSASTSSGCSPNFNGTLTVVETDLSVGINIMSGDGIYAVSCADGSDGAVQAVVSGGSSPYQYMWSTGNQEEMVEGLEPGDYTLMVTTSRGCQREASVTLNSPELLAVTINEVPASCVDSIPTLVIQDIQGGIGPYVFGTTGSALSPAGSLPDSLKVPVGGSTFVLEDANGCLLSQSFNFDPAPLGELVVTPSNAVIRLGDSVALSVLTDLNTDGFFISPGPEEPIVGNEVFVAPMASTTYTITVIDPNGCSATATAKVLVDRYVPVYAPTAFSPNLDGTNDLYRVFAHDQVLEIADFFIFNRWGDNVFNFPGPVGPEETNWGWDGTAADGRPYEQGTYVYSVRVTLLDGREVTLKGDFVLMR